MNDDALNELAGEVRTLTVIVSQLQDQMKNHMQTTAQDTLQEGLEHIEGWCERLQDTMDRHLEACAHGAQTTLRMVESVGVDVRALRDDGRGEQVIHAEKHLSGP